MTTLQSAEDVRRALPPNTSISREVLYCNSAGVYLDLHRGEGGVVDGIFSHDQLLALTFWINHPEAFPADPHP